MTSATPETNDLKESFKRSGIWRIGLSFKDVMDNDILRQTLIMSTKSRLRHLARTENHTTQPALF